MNEIERIVREAAALATDRSPFLLATVVRVSGSSYRRPGARMLVAGDRWLSGCVSGGCLEGDVMLRGEHRCRDGAVVVTYDSTTEDGEAWGVGLGCNGVVDVLLEHVAAGATHDALAFAGACFAEETTGTLVTVIRSTACAVRVGARLAFGPPCALAHPVADPAARSAIEAVARGPAGVAELDGLGITVLVEKIAPSPQLFVLGGGHDAVPLVTLAKSVGFRVTVASPTLPQGSRFLAADRVLSTGGAMDRLGALIDAAAEPYVVIMHHQRTPDRDALAVALASRARYIGVLGPARRTRDLLAEIGRRPGDDPRIHAPIGLDLGAETPEQIALSVVGELQAVARRAQGGKLRDRARALHAGLALVVLAAGGSRRLGRPKQLVELDGAPLVRRVATACVEARSGPVGVVLGAHAGVVARALGDLGVALIANDGWEEGIASSIRAAVRWAEASKADALLIALADQPLITVEHLTALRNAWLAGAPIAASRFSGVVGAPAVFDRSRWDALSRLEGDQGAGRLLRAEDIAAIDWAGGAIDVDTADDVRALGGRAPADQPSC
ncbi:NTP transferase domain-containing protein [Sorangium sp. So ce1014]|uniref:NTP transferase domain-containing protein n=1 Tax=Sorangium sp. So ce1014 TaxID=3133326 RepID=UPI003F5F2093